MNPTIKRILPLLFILPGALLAASKMHQTGIDWQDWSVPAFEQAKNENKIILVNVGMEGCAACYRMDKITGKIQEKCRTSM